MEMKLYEGNYFLLCQTYDYSLYRITLKKKKVHFFVFPFSASGPVILFNYMQ